MKLDDVSARYADRDVNLSLRLLHDEGVPYVLIEAPADGLRMLAELRVALAGDARDDGFQFGPDGAGSVHFSPSSEFGLYLHRSGASE